MTTQAGINFQMNFQINTKINITYRIESETIACPSADKAISTNLPNLEMQYSQLMDFDLEKGVRFATEVNRRTEELLSKKKSIPMGDPKSDPKSEAKSDPKPDKALYIKVTWGMFLSIQPLITVNLHFQAACSSCW
jgi:hypothetical protein